MSTALTTAPPDVAAIEKVILNGDLKDLKPAERLSYYNQVCESLGLNPLTQPFAYLSLSGKMILYARKDAAEQLRSVRNISLEILSREIIEGVYVVTTRAQTPAGRTDSATGAVPIENLKGEARANAMMKAETKAKRRVTLSICGLGLMDETEVENIEGARKVSVDQAHTLIEAGNGGDAVQSAPAPSGASNRHVPEELMVVVDKLRKGDFSAVKQSCAFLEGECKELGIAAAYTNRNAGIRSSFPRGTVIPGDVMEGFLLDVWSEIEAMRLRRAGENAPEPKAAEPVKYAEGVEDSDVPF
jgi:hypothetical protein